MASIRTRAVFGAFLTGMLAICLTTWGKTQFAHAEEETNTAPVCKIGNKAYGSIAEAVAAVPGNGSATITMIDDSAVEEPVIVPAGKTITIADDGTARRIEAIAGMFDVRGKLTIAGTSDENLQLFGGAGGSDFGNVATVGKDGTGHFTLEAGTLHGGTIDNPSNGAVYMADGTFDMKGGVITDCKGQTYFNAPVYVSGNGVMDFSGGSIQGNSSDSCAGIMVSALPDTKHPTLNMSGGTIKNNTNTSVGDTAIRAMTSAVVNLSGGEISHNNSTGEGSVVRIAVKSVLTMTGGKIIDNTCDKGSAVTVTSSEQSSFKAGEIARNTNSLCGGAIFASRKSGSIYVQDCLVTNNKATIMGGGLWCCPTGGAQINASEGIATFDNAAEGAGDDFASLYAESIKGDITLSSRILGGGKVAYYADGAVQPGKEDDWRGTPVEDMPRFDASNPGEPVIVAGAATENLALKAQVADAGKERAAERAKMLIHDNTSLYGGGIACNGILAAGKTDQEDKEYQVTVTKQDGVKASISGAELVITNELGTVIDEWTTEADVDHQLNLTAGMYTLSEKRAPAGYKKAADIEFELTANGTLIVGGESAEKVIMTDEFDDHELTINKVDPDGKSLKGAKLQITGETLDGEKFETEWISDGSDHVLKLQPGTYTFHETAAPKGYLPINDFQFTVNIDGTIESANAAGSKTEQPSDSQIKLEGNILTITDLVDEGENEGGGEGRDEGYQDGTESDGGDEGDQSYESEETEEPENPNKEGSSNATANSSSSATSSAKAPKQKTGTPAQTGDGAVLPPLATLIVAGAAGCLLIWKRRRSQ